MGRAARRQKLEQDERSPPPRVRSVTALEGPRILVVWELERGDGDIIDLTELFTARAAYSSLLEDRKDFEGVRLDANGEAITWGYLRQIPADYLRGMVKG